MSINIYPKASATLPNYLIAFLLHSNQVGVGVLGFQRYIVKESGHDAWISVIIGGLLAHLTLWVMIKTLQRYPSSDLFGIHADVYGKRLGGIVSLVFIIYFMLSALIVLRSYIEIVQTWLFPEVSTWTFALVFLFLVFYTVNGGIRVIAGYTFITVLLAIWLLVGMIFPLQYAKWIYLFPMFSSGLKELVSGALAMALTMSGFEIIYVLFPFVQNKERIGYHSQLALSFTNLLYLILMLVSLVFFSHDQLMKTIWASLSMEKMVRFSFLERFEFIAVSIWLFVIMPNLMLFMWSTVRGIKRLVGWNQRKTLVVIMLIIFGACLLADTRQEINMINTYFSKISLIVTFAYPFFLYFLVVIKQSWQKRKDGQSNEVSSRSEG
ncbi:GerAB/ArcD/ProY family transporter [Brevibacillus sp. SYSU BS000544]|uniref:GerAB/ArcD/ProY family transporter n=1 Tax=Brevibacillus sp. SYSU BS000544 TaxID=3416443 RepID=UPI003CE4ABAC